MLLGSSIAVLAVDQSAKGFVTSTFALGETWVPIPILADYFAITRSTNTGAAFGLLPEAGTLFLVIAVIVIGVILLSYQRMTSLSWLEQLAFSLLLGGTTSNALDRIRLGHVVDMVHFQWQPYFSNVSNLADHAIVMAVALLFIAHWRRERIKKSAVSRDHSSA